jgi:hypothetical protein
MRRQVLAVLLAFVVWAAVAPSASAGIGAGSKMAVESQTQMMFRQQGGGYIDWEISGPVASLVRQNVDQNFGDGDGNVTSAEANSYTAEIEAVLENYVFYGSVRIMGTALLNKDINTDTAGLVGRVNSSRSVVIHFMFSANLRVEGVKVNFGDQRMPMAPFRALRGEPNQTFDGELDWKHMEIVVGLASFSAFNPDRGQFSRLRGPGVEVVWYSLQVTNRTSNDQARFDTFSVLQCPLELFIVLCVFGLLALWFPRHFMKTRKMLKVRRLHLAVILLVVLAMAVFLLGVDGLAVWVVSPLAAVLSCVLSWGIYSQGWKGLAKSAVPAIPARPRSAAALFTEPAAQEGPAHELSEAVPVAEAVAVPAGIQAPARPTPPPLAQPMSPAPGPRPPAPGPSYPAPGPRPPAPGPSYPAPGPRPPAPSPSYPAPGTRPPAPGTRPSLREIRCPKCKGTFSVNDPLTRPLAIKCTLCGAEGVLRK